MDTILDDIGLATRVKGSDLLNLLNYVNFREGTIYVTFRHEKLGKKVSVQAVPLPTARDCLDCRWLAPGLSASVLNEYVFESFLVSDGQNHVVVNAELLAIDSQKVSFRIPEFGYDQVSRKIHRHLCHGVTAQLLQNGLRFQGVLVDFNAAAFRLEVSEGDPGALHWLNPQFAVTVLLEKDGKLLFSGECRTLRTEFRGNQGTCIVAPDFSNIQRYRPREFRSLRQELVPPPSVSFHHPLTGRLVYLSLKNLSGSGFAVEEFLDASVLFSGLMIPDIHVSVGSQVLLRASGQVLYRNVLSFDQGKSLVQCGVVFLDMALDDQVRLAALLHQSTNSSLQVNTLADMDELWRFFFESGFFYPSKYLTIEANKEEFKRTYEKLYLRSTAIARAFTFQDKGVLFAHMSMIRVYPESWLIHHHAASKSGYGMAGVAVLDQIGRYMNEFHNHRATHARYVMCYYRQENKFPSRVFGGSARDAANPKANSLDTFAYLQLSEGHDDPLASVQVFPASADDLAVLKDHYELESGGLMLDAMNLSSHVPEDELTQQYRQLGLNRDHLAFSLKGQGSLLAVVTLSLSNLGLNLSNLTNCFHVLVLDGEKLSAGMLFAALKSLAVHYHQEDLPVLIAPDRWAREKSVAYDKEYLLWVLDLECLDGYFHSIQDRFKRIRHEP